MHTTVTILQGSREAPRIRQHPHSLLYRHQYEGTKLERGSLLHSAELQASNG